MTRAGRTLAWLAAVAALLAIGWWTGVRAGRAPPPADGPVDRAVVRQALETWRLEAGDVGGPLRMLVLSERVVAIDRAPGHCDTPVPGAFPSPEHYDRTLRLRTYTLFGLPLQTVRFTCGGLAWRTG